MVRQTPGAIGYVELIYALQNKIDSGLVKNPGGVFMKASIESVTAAAASMKQMPADYRVSITNAPGKDAYPISSFTWLLVPNPGPDGAKSKVIKDFLTWMLDHESEVTSLNYAPLPEVRGHQSKGDDQPVEVARAAQRRFHFGIALNECWQSNSPDSLHWK